MALCYQMGFYQSTMQAAFANTRSAAYSVSGNSVKQIEIYQDVLTLYYMHAVVVSLIPSSKCMPIFSHTLMITHATSATAQSTDVVAD